MKNLMLALLLIISVQVFAQSFEGTITWSVKMEITDPKMKAQMEESQKMMQDPAKIKEMEEQMNNPQFKAMMEQNPQMKAQMEKMMAMMKSGGVNSLIPKGMVFKIKKEDALFKMEGGLMENEFLYRASDNKTYQLDRDNKTYSVIDHNEDDDTDESADHNIKVTKTSERAKIAGYSCTKYLVEVTEDDAKVSRSIWATTELKDINIQELAKKNMKQGNDDLFFYKDIDGFPLKMVENRPEGVVTIEVTEVKRGSLPASDFVVPSDFKLVKGMGF